MNAQAKSRRDEVVLHLYGLIKASAKRKGCRVKKLDKVAREGVINGALARLMELDAVFGNCQSIRGNFWYELDEAKYKLIDRAIDAERQSYIRATSASGGELLNPATQQDDLERFTEAGNPFETEPSHLLEQQDQIEAEERAMADRKQLAEGEFKVMWAAINAYGDTLRLAHRKALFLIRDEPKLTNSTIAAQVSLHSIRGIAPATVAKIRDKFYSLSAKFLSLMEDPDDALNMLVREVETLKKEMAVIKAERRRDSFLQNHSIEDFEALRVWAAPFCEALGQSVDELLGATIVPKPST